nr:hypothetical protein [Pseudomonadota bacterium]
AVDRENNCLRDTGPIINQEGVRYDVCRGDVRASVIAYRCSIDPFNLQAGVSSRKYDCSLNRDFNEIRSARVTLCKDPMTSGDPLCQYQSTQAFLTSCARDPFNSPCVAIGDPYETDRANRITNCLIDASPLECTHQAVRAALLKSCNSIIDNREPAAPGCDTVTRDFCPTAIGAAAFNSVCDADYTQLQVAACTADAGADAGCTMLLETNCPAGNTKPECLIATTAVWENHAVNSDNTARLDVLDEVGRDDPHVNYVKAGADGLNLGFVLDENDNLKPTAIVDERVLKSYDGGTYEDTASGVAFAFINYGGFTDNGANGGLRYYAGILSGTDLGGPVTNTTDTDVDWTGKYGIILSGRYYTKDFTLTINFAEKSISGTDTNGCTVGDNTCSVYDPESRKYVPNIIEKLTLTGNFNDAGVIYGTSRVEWTNPNLFSNANCRQNLVAPATDNNPAIYNLKCTQLKRQGFPTDDSPETPFSEGTLTGLIGERGAVGVFAGVGATVPIRNEDDDGNIYHGFSTGSAYVGGFVVDNPAVSPECSAANPRNLFNLVLCPSPECSREADDPPCPNPLGEMRRDICKERGTSGVNLPTGVTVGDCSTPELVTLICKATVAPLDPLCTDDFYDDTRQLVCGGQDVNNPEQPLCAPVIEKLCTAEPFNRNAGPGANKFDCASANSVGVVNARNTRITLCLAEATKDDPLCKQGDVSEALASCAGNPDGPICATDGIRAALTVCSDNPSDPICIADDVSVTLAVCADNPRGLICTQGVSAIVTACVAQRANESPQSPLSPLCQLRGASAVLATCDADPFDAACTPFATQYTQARETHLTTCGGKASLRVDVKCDNARPTLCAEGGTPFAQICEGYDTTQATIIAQTCATSATPAHEDCNTVVSAVSGGDDVLVKHCIENPYKARCSSAVFYPARAAICESEATSFTAGCLSDSDFASNYRPVEVAEEKRADFLARCKDPDPARDKAGCHTIVARTAREALVKTCAGAEGATGCNTIIANSTTLLQCIANPFLADCSGEVIASALANSPDAVTRRDALVARCGNDGDASNDEGCDTIVGTSTIAGCALDPTLVADCSGGVFDAYIVFDCTLSANVFAPRCQGGIDESIITARAELALGCAEDSGGAGCDTIIVSGALTVKNCNDTPFVAGCEDVAFANARRDSCKTTMPKPAACGVAEGQGYTNYVQGGASELELGDSIYKHDNPLTLDVHEGAVYVEDDPKTTGIDESVAVDTSGDPIEDNKDTPLDESRVLVVLPEDNDMTDIDESRYLREGIVKGGLTLNDLVAATDNEKSGFAFAYIPEGRGGINGTDRYYAGLLSGTDMNDSLGLAITADAMWHGKVFIVSGLGGSILTEQADFILDINFANKTLTSGDIAVPRLGGFFAIDGKFAGKVIYGATSLRDGLRNGISSIGSVTGLIGENGAVGAFVSSGTGALVNTFGEYAGGFVAHKDAPDPTPAPQDCSDTANLHPSCADTPNDVDLCVAYNLASLQDPNGNDGLNSTQIAARVIAQTKCIPVLERLAAQETACMGEADLNTLTEPLCEAIITRVCDGNIFNDAAGTGDTEFNCTEVTRYDDRRKQACRNPVYHPIISACGDIIVDICTNDDPFTQTTGRNPTNLCDSTYNDARKVACMGEITNGMPAPQKCSDTIVQVCTDNPFDENFCFASNFDYTATQLRLCYADMTAGGVVDEVDACTTVLQANCQPTAGEPHVECRGARFTQWVDDVNTDDSDAAVASIPADEPKKARILLGRANGLDTKTNVTSILAPEFVLRFSLNKYNRVPHATETQVVKVIDPANPLNLIDKTIPTYTNVLNEDYNNGIAVFSATTTNGTIGHYAGILSGTNVGVPITYAGVGQVDVQPDAKWEADIAWVSDNGRFVKRAYAFELNVDFAKGTISTPTDSGITDSLGHLPRYANTDSLSFSAFWTANGILIGTTTLRIPNPVTQSQRTSYGILTGMIGNDGAVGVFASEPRIGNDGQPIANPFAYAGGFVAKPKTNRPPVVATPTPIPPTATTWFASFDTATHNRHERTNSFGYTLLAEGRFARDGTSRYGVSFATGQADGLGLNPETGDYKASNFSKSPEFVLRLDDTIDSTGYTSGVTFFYGNIAKRDNERFVAGLLNGTTVGDNLPYRQRYLGQASAIWGGVISGNFGGYSDGEFGAKSANVFPSGITVENQLLVTDRNFQLLINFEGATVKTPTGKGAFGGLGSVNFRFDGQFDRNGIMNGTISVDSPDKAR